MSIKRVFVFLKQILPHLKEDLADLSLVCLSFDVYFDDNLVYFF